jgi:hypothetical protein
MKKAMKKAMKDRGRRTGAWLRIWLWGACLDVSLTGGWSRGV